MRTQASSLAFTALLALFPLPAWAAPSQCVITARSCPTGAAPTGTFSDSVPESSVSPSRCLDRSVEVQQACKTNDPVIARYFRAGALIASRTARTSCRITATSCPADPGYVGTFADNDAAALADPDRCMERAGAYQLWCGSNEPVTAQFFRSDQLVTTRISETGCRITAPSCPGNPAGAGIFADSDPRSKSMPVKCIARAAEYQRSCGTYEEVTTEFIRGGTVIATGNAPALPSKKLLELQAYIDALAPNYVGKGTNPMGMPKYPSQVLIVVTPESSKILGYGSVLGGRKPTERDLYPISSMSKMITGLILAQGVVKKDFELNAQMKTLIKSSLKDGLKDETLGQAITHFASFQDLPTNVNVNSHSPFAPAERYDYASLASALKQDSVSRTGAPIGSQYLYSSLGSGLVGLALMDFYAIPNGPSIPFARSLDALLRMKGGIVDELGLDQTRAFAITEGDSSNPSIVKGYTQGDIEIPAADMGVLGASGSILSSGKDMLKLMQMILRFPGKWGDIIKEATRPLRLKSPEGGSIGYAIDILHRDGMTLYSKSGDQFGFSSLIIWNKESGIGLVALTNRGKDSESLADMLVQIHSKAAELYETPANPSP